jgi:hypothetical protein
MERTARHRGRVEKRRRPRRRRTAGTDHDEEDRETHRGVAWRRRRVGGRGCELGRSERQIATEQPAESRAQHARSLAIEWTQATRHRRPHGRTSSTENIRGATCTQRRLGATVRPALGPYAGMQTSALPGCRLGSLHTPSALPTLQTRASKRGSPWG